MDLLLVWHPRRSSVGGITDKTYDRPSVTYVGRMYTGVCRVIDQGAYGRPGEQGFMLVPRAGPPLAISPERGLAQR